MLRTKFQDNNNCLDLIVKIFFILFFWVAFILNKCYIQKAMRNVNYSATEFSPWNIDNTSETTKYTIGPSSINTNVSPQKEFSRANIAVRKGINHVLSGTEKLTNEFIRNFIIPYPGNQLNTLNVALGRSVERDFNTALKYNEFAISRPFGMTWVMNYPRAWINSGIRYTTPKYVQKKIHQRMVRNHDIWTYPVKKARLGISKISRKTAQTFYSESGYRNYLKRKNIQKRKNRELIDKNMYKLNKAVNFKIKLPRLKTSRFENEYYNLAA